MSKTTVICAIISVICISFSTGQVFAHHSFFAEFSSQTGAIEGEVIEIFYQNPHAHYYIKTINEDGNEEIWDAHGQNIRRMLRFGWKKNTLKLGDKVKIMGNLGINDTKKIAIMRAEKEDGSKLSLIEGGQDSDGYVNAFSESQVVEDKNDEQ